MPFLNLNGFCFGNLIPLHLPLHPQKIRLLNIFLCGKITGQEAAPCSPCRSIVHGHTEGPLLNWSPLELYHCSDLPVKSGKPQVPEGLFLMVQVFQLQDSRKAFLVVSFGRSVSIYLICQDFTRPSKSTKHFSHCLQWLEHFTNRIFWLYSKKVKMPYLGLFLWLSNLF